jgi:hypothetical protein
MTQNPQPNRVCGFAQDYAQATAYADAGDFAQAEAIYRDLLLNQPDNADLYNKLGWVLRKQARWLDALLAFRAGLQLCPDAAGLCANLSLILLQLGAYEEAWRLYEYRLRDEPALRCPLPFPPWRGQAPAGLRFLIVGEQGLGDVIQFCRYAPLLAEQGATVDVLVRPELVNLLSSLDGVRGVFSELQTTTDAYDVHSPLMSLPHYCGTTVHTIPSQVPYVHPPPQALSRWQDRVAQACAGDNALWRVGLVWAGGHRPLDVQASAIDRRRSLDLADCLPWFDLPGICWFSLQLGPAAAAWGALRTQASPALAARMHDFTADITDFVDTAALNAQLDLVISVDTAPAHLAGACGRPVWILNRYDQCWRWLHGRTDSPWYPTARLFRQPQPGHWGSVIAAVRAALQGRFPKGRDARANQLLY